MSRIVQLDVVRRGLVGHEEFPGVRLISLVGTDSAVRNAAQVLAVERLEGEPYLFVSSLCHIHLEFLPGEWVTAFEGSHIKILISLEPSLFIGIEEGEPFGVEGSLETPAGSLPLSCQLGSKQAGNRHEAVLISHTLADVCAYILVVTIFTKDTGTIGINESLSVGIVEDEAFTLADELEPLQPFVTSFPTYDIVRIFAFASHLLTLVVHKSVEALSGVVSSQGEALVVAYCCALLVNLREVHIEIFVTFCHPEYVGTFCSFE